MVKDLVGLALLHHHAAVHEYDTGRRPPRAKPISWVTTAMVMPVFAMVFITESTSPTSSGSNAAVEFIKQNRMGL